MVFLLLMAGIGVVFLVAFWWALPHDLNPGPFSWERWYVPQWRWWQLWSNELEASRRLRRAQGLPASTHHREWVDDMPSAQDLARWGGEPEVVRTVDENAELPARRVVDEDDENAEVAGDDEGPRAE